MNHLLEALFSIVGILFTIAKVVGTIKAFIWVGHEVEPFAKKVLVNQRAELIRQHVFADHGQSLRYCNQGQCPSLG